MEDEWIELFGEVREAFAKHPTAIDVQSDTMDILQIVQSICGTKAVFMGMAGDALRAAPYADAIVVAATRGALTGSGRINVHHRARALQIAERSIAEAVEARSRTPANVYWSTRNPELHALFEGGDTTGLTDSELLGYPECCAVWHYDCFFARGTEAFADVHVQQGSTRAALAELSRGWFPSSGWFLPRDYYLAAILIGNHRYPFVEHIACPRCIRDRASPTAAMNDTSSEIVLACDPGRHASVRRFAEDLEEEISELLQDRTAMVQAASDGLRLSARGRDVYKRHSRYLYKALGLDDYRR